jgi:hypothetical protein
MVSSFAELALLCQYVIGLSLTFLDIFRTVWGKLILITVPLAILPVHRSCCYDTA